MKRLFSVDSPIFQLLSRLVDLIVLNLLFLLCSFPVVTIGAAQAGLMTAVRALQQDKPVYRAFFRGFRSGFVRITLLWTLGLLLLCGLLYVFISAIWLDASLSSFAVLSAAVAALLLAMFLSMATAFHSRFGCTLWQILRNSWFLSLIYPLRTLCMTALYWAPAIALVWNSNAFARLLPLWLLIYYAAAGVLCAALVKKPFMKLIEQFFPDALIASQADQLEE